MIKYNTAQDNCDDGWTDLCYDVVDNHDGDYDVFLVGLHMIGMGSDEVLQGFGSSSAEEISMRIVVVVIVVVVE